MLALSSFRRCGSAAAPASAPAPAATSRLPPSPVPGPAGVAAADAWRWPSVRATGLGGGALARDQLVGDAQDVLEAAAAHAVLAVDHHRRRGIDAAADDELLGARDLRLHREAVDGAAQLGGVGTVLGHVLDDVVGAGVRAQGALDVQALEHLRVQAVRSEETR